VIGERIGNFQIVSQLGAGGMGEVFLGEHAKIGTKVAIKMLQPHISANTEHVQRFFNEAIAVSKIQHAGIGKIFDVGFTDAGRAYLVMEFLDGETLASRIKRLGRLPITMVSDIGKQMTSVLEAVHKAGITHRDLKPDNVFLVADSELASGERVKILDFGIAKLSGYSGGMTATAAGSMGTPAYMSPEQWKNSKNVDWRADAYSLGCLVFEMVAGRPPFLAESIGEACAKHLTEVAPHLRSLVPTPIALDTLIVNLLAKDPAQRPGTMREIGNAFAALGVTRDQGLAATLVPQAAESAPIPMMVPRTAQAPNTTLGGAAASAQTPAGSGKRRTWLVALVLALVVLAGIVTVLAVTMSSSQPAEVVASNTEPPPATPSPPVQAVPRPVPPSAVADHAPVAEPTNVPAANVIADAGTAEVSPIVPQRQPPPVADSKPRGITPTPSERTVPTPSGIGYLAIGTRPPCQIYIDGLDTGLVTPQRRIPVPAGKHIVAFRNNDFAIKETVTVYIQPDQVEKLVKDFSDKVVAAQAAPTSAGCDEVSCVLNNYEGACCAKFRKVRPPNPVPVEADDKPKHDVPESLDRSMISAGIANAKGRVAACAEKSTAKGQVRVVIKVNPDGSVANVSVRTAPDDVLGSCVAAEVAHASFAKTQQGGSFTYPFVF
jgi:serine/threonine-protein kinase